MHTFIWSDVRLKGWKPAGDVIESNLDTPLAWMINRINDRAERGVDLIQAFNETTKDESQKQYHLQVVEKHRKEFPKRNREVAQM